MKNFEKPTVEQVAWVFDKLLENKNASFRYLIYDRMGFDSLAYMPLYEAGGMRINNIICDYFEAEEEKNDGGA